MSIYLSKATEKDLANLQKIADREDELIEMRDRYGILLAVSTGLKSLTEEKDKNGKPLYRVESKKILDYDHQKEIILYDVQLDIYKGKKPIMYSNQRTQQFFDKQEQFWFERVEKFIKNPWVLIGSDVIVNRVK